MDLRILNNEERLLPRDWVDKYQPEAKRKLLKEWEHTIGGAKAYSFTVSGPDGEGRYTFISKDNKIFAVQFSYLPVPETESQKYDKETLFKMLDTFKFLDY